MKNRTKSLPLLVLVAVVALVIGSFGTATASGMSKGKVKKMVTQVVKKQAPSLSVASAGNATNLAGKPASAYTDDAIVYTSSTGTATTSHTIAVPLGPGSYTIGYSVLMAGGSGYSFCQVQRIRAGSPVLLVADDTSQAVSTPSASGYGFVDVAAGDSVKLYCASATAWSIAASQPAQVVVTPVDGATTPAPLPAAGGVAEGSRA